MKYYILKTFGFGRQTLDKLKKPDSLNPTLNECKSGDRVNDDNDEGKVFHISNKHVVRAK